MTACSMSTTQVRGLDIAIDVRADKCLTGFVIIHKDSGAASFVSGDLVHTFNDCHFSDCVKRAFQCVLRVRLVIRTTR